MSKPLNKPIVIEMTQPDTCHKYYRFVFKDNELVGSGGFFCINVEKQSITELLMLTVHYTNFCISQIQRRSLEIRHGASMANEIFAYGTLHNKPLRLEEISFGEYFIISKGISHIARASYESDNNIVKTYRIDEGD